MNIKSLTVRNFLSTKPTVMNLNSESKWESRLGDTLSLTEIKHLLSLALESADNPNKLIMFISDKERFLSIGFTTNDSVSYNFCIYRNNLRDSFIEKLGGKESSRTYLLDKNINNLIQDIIDSLNPNESIIAV